MTDFEDYISDAPSAKELKERVRIQRDNIKSVMNTPRGRAFIHEVLDFCGWKGNPLHVDPTVIGYNVGKQNVANWIESMIDNECPNLLLTMKTERKSKENLDDGSTSNGDTS